MVWLVAVLLLIVLVFGISSGMDSYATAKQAEATIEVAKVAQVNAWGNLVTIVTIALLAVIFVALVAVIVWAIFRRSNLNMQRAARASRQMAEPKPQQQLSMNDLTQLLMLDVLRSMRSNPPPAALEAPKSAQPDEDDPLSWLK